MSARCEREIKAYEATERQEPSPPGCTLFIGDSTIRLWRNMAEDMKPVKTINRGLGGARMEDCLQAVERLIIPVNPARVILSCGENDLVEGKKPNLLLGQIRDFFSSCREGVGHVERYFISLKPSPANAPYWPLMAKVNQAIREWSEIKGEIGYIDIAGLIMAGEANPSPDLFITNGTHLSFSGYEMLKKATRKTILK